MAIEVALALGSGGVKGFSHLGVLRALRREGVQIRAIAGSSIGGLIGSLYAAGFNPEEIENRLLRMDQSRLYRRRTGDGPGIYGFSNIQTLLESQLGDLQFEDLEIPFAVTAVDIDNGQLLAFQKGNIVRAVLATIAVPGVFPPVNWKGRTLLDGGLLDPVPVSLARKLAPDMPVISVVLTPPLGAWQDGGQPIHTGRYRWLAGLLRLLSGLRHVQALKIVVRSAEIARARAIELQLALDAPDIVIRPEVSEFGLLDKVDILDLALRGEKAAGAVMEDLRGLTCPLGDDGEHRAPIQEYNDP